MTTEQIKQLAEREWTQYSGYNGNDKELWINGFVIGYLNARVDSLSDRMDTLKVRINDLNDQIEMRQNKITDMLINGNA